MRERMYNRLAAISGIMAICMIALLPGCASIPKETDMKESLRLEAEKYWKLRMEDKYEDTYRMEDTQGLPPFDTYRNKAQAMKRVAIRSISVTGVAVSEGKGDVDLEWSYMLPNISQPFKQVIKDEWAFREGQWQHKFPR